MPAPEEYTAYEAGDPGTAPQVLAQIAEHRPDLRPLVAANPATPPAVLDLLAGLGDVAVDAALAGRRDGQPGADATEPLRADATQLFAPPAPAAYQPGPYGTPSQGAPYGAPAPGPFGAPQPPYAAPGPYAAPQDGGGNPFGAPVPPYGGSGPAGAPAYAAPSWQQPAGRSRRWVWWVAAGAVALVVVCVVAAAALVRASESGEGLLGGATYGSDPYLDELWDACADGDAQACDDLYNESPLFSEYEEFGDTCGYRFPDGGQWCADVMEA
ncbi:hypothetical protein [Georgenia sp. AZ-5]|uniref:variant leucine-rich repeat-containing protein n=1 Tax=Georgenia sp. AZ-5 TaxID=3367526 RepID=UPI003754FE6A